MNPLESHSRNEVKINKAKKEIPFCGRHFNRPTVVTSTDSPTATNDYYKEMCDINVIIAKHMLTQTPLPSIDKALYNLMPDGTQVSETVGQFTNFTDRYLAAKDNFMSLPSNLRAKFNNDVRQFADYLATSSDATINEMLKNYGLKQDDVTPAVGNQDLAQNTSTGDTPSVSSTTSE